MKKLTALVLCLCLVCGLSACAQPEKEEEAKKQTYYFLKEKRMYIKDEQRQSVSFSYDKHGRPTAIELKLEENKTHKAEIEYDKKGNKIKEVYAITTSGGTRTRQTEYQLTYDGDKLIRSENNYDGRKDVALDIEYDNKGRITMITYDTEGTDPGDTLWHSFTYDAKGRLIQETACTNKVGYALEQVQYKYNDDTHSVVIGFFASGNYPEPFKPGAENELKLQLRQYYYFFFNKNGELIHTDPTEDIYTGEDLSIAKNPEYNFDKNGNLISYNSGETRIEYEYIELKLTKEEAELAMRFKHGISEELQTYSMFTTADPIYPEVGVPHFVIPMLYTSVYYLIPYPMWGVPPEG